MDAVQLQDAANAVWTVLATGAGSRVGAASTAQALHLLARIRPSRRARGVATDPGTPNELLEELQRLPASEQRAAINLVPNIFEAPVDARHANFGIEISS